MLLAKLASGDAQCRARLLDAVGAPDSVRIYAAVDGDEAYAYVDTAADVGSAHVAALQAIAGVTLVSLLPLATIDGASARQPAPYHYVVETDVAPGHEPDFNAWYDREHLPGLAAVPGTVRASRFRALEAHPRYYACYDLTRPETLGSDRWLAVRHTAWSDRVRPAFRNTKRTMFRRT